MQFSTYRVWLLSKKQWAENQQLYFLGLLALAGIMAAAFSFNFTQREGLTYSNQQSTLLAGAGISGAIFSSTILSQFTDKIKGIQALSLPASAFEKLVTALIYTLVIFPLAYLLVAYPVLVIMHYVDNQFVGHTSSLYNLTFKGDISKTFIPYIMLQAMVLLCSVVFKRYNIVKTIVVIFICFFGVVSVNPPLANKMLNLNIIKNSKINLRQVLYNESGDRVKDTTGIVNITQPAIIFAAPYGDASISFTNDVYPIPYSYNLPPSVNVNMILSVTDTYKIIFSILSLLIAPFLWLITWFRLRETQL
jgi:hypothetical protein